MYARALSTTEIADLYKDLLP